MAESADVVIIGGGIVGASIAYHLVESGAKNILVLEREPHLGKGSTGKSMGGVRAQFSTAINIRLSLYSIDFFTHFEAVTGYASGYKPQGYLFVATTPPQLDYLHNNFALQTSLGLQTVRLLNPDDVLRIVPPLRGDDILGGSFCSTDGFVDPYSVMTGFMTRAVEKGVRLWKGAEVTAIQHDPKGIASVTTSRGEIATRVVVNAAGAWAAEVARLAGVEIPVQPLRRMLVPTEPFPLISPESPMTIDMATGFHFRPEGRGLLLAWADPEETPGYKTNFDPPFLEKILTRAVSRVPCMDGLEVDSRRAWAGLYEMTPDRYPILGPARSLPGFYLANGFSGHGVMHSPATGRIISDLILKGGTDLVDAHTLDLERFAEGRLIHETAVL